MIICVNNLSAVVAVVVVADCDLLTLIERSTSLIVYVQVHLPFTGSTLHPFKKRSIMYLWCLLWLGRVFVKSEKCFLQTESTALR